MDANTVIIAAAILLKKSNEWLTVKAAKALKKQIEINN